eukprot:28828-Rhodomonas_salina.3
MPAQQGLISNKYPTSHGMCTSFECVQAVIGRVSACDAPAEADPRKFAIVADCRGMRPESTKQWPADQH